MRSNKIYPLLNNSLIGLAVSKLQSKILLRFRQSGANDTFVLEETEPQKKIDWLVLDHDRKEAYVDGRSVKLARKEYLLLKLLYENAGKVCEREEIAAFVWPEYASDGVADEQIDQLVRSVRKLVDPDPKKPPRLVTRRKFGYLLEIGD